MSRTRRYWFSKARPFQLATITCDEAPSPQAKRPGAASAMAATLWASSAGPRVYAGVMATPRFSVGLPGGGEGEGREAVGAVDLGRPDVGVSQLAQAGEPLAVGVQRDPRRMGS